MKMKATVFIGRKGKGLRIIWKGVEEGRSETHIYQRLRERYPEASRITLDPPEGDRGTHALEMLDKLYGAPPGWPSDDPPESPANPAIPAAPRRHPLLEAIPLAKSSARPARGPQKRRDGHS